MSGALPFRLCGERDNPQVEWVRSDGERFTEPFFQETAMRLRRIRRQTGATGCPRSPVAGLRDFRGGLPVAGLIFHVSRCGSTLLARMLAAVPRNLVLSEPQIVDDLLRLPQRNSSFTEGDIVDFLRGAIAALGQPPAGGAQQLFLKLDCWHLFSLPFIQHVFPGVPALFVYRDPLEVLVSLMRRPSLTLARDTIAPEQLGLTTEQRDVLSREEHAAAILGAFYRIALSHRASLVPIAYERLPEMALRAFPALNWSEEERESMRVAAEFDAKKPKERFVADSADKRAEATPALRAAAAEWAEPAYRDWAKSLTKS